MGKIKPNTHTRNTAHRGPDYVEVLPNGKMRCPNGYELLKQDDMGSYRCSGGAHRYQIPPDKLEQDKFGNLYIKASKATCEGEE